VVGVKDFEGERLEVQVMSYRQTGTTITNTTICIQDITGYLVPLDAAGARKLAKKLVKAAEKLEAL
jgi:hypothetical protein